MKTRTDWEPSEAQQRLLSLLQGDDYEMDVAKACTAAEVGRQTYYDWTHIPEFVTWWRDQRERFWAMKLPAIDAATFKAATSKEPQPRGSSADRKLFYERYDKGYLPKSKHELAHTGAVPVDLSQMSQEQLERQAHAAGLKEPKPDGDAG